MLPARKTLPVLMILLALAGGTSWLAGRWAPVGGGIFSIWLTWLLIILSGIFCFFWLVLFRQRHISTLNSIREQLQQFEQTDRIGMIMIEGNDELGGLACEINQYLSNIKMRFEKQRLERKELLLQSSVAETESRQGRAIIQSISEAVIVTDRFDEILTANQAAQELLDFQFSPESRQPVNTAIKDQDLLQMLKQVCQEKSTNLIRLVQRTHPLTGKMLDLKVLTSCVFDDEKEVIGVVMVIHDITTEKEIARMKDDFVNCVTHELKTPLASIRAYAELIAEGEVGPVESQQQFCSIIQEQAERLNRLIDDILNISHIQAGHLELVLEPCALRLIIEQAITTIRPQALEKNIELVSSLPEAEINILVDQDLIYQAVLNLLSNAVKYSQRDGKVTLRAWQDNEGRAYLEVEDQGVGIPADELERIFEKFYRVPQNNSQAEGNGLGLHLVHEIIQILHKGTITVKSQPGQGSTFTISLPLCQTGEPVLCSN